MQDIINPSLGPEIVQPDSVASGAGETNPPLDEQNDAGLGFGTPSLETQNVNPPLGSASVSLESAGGGVINPPLDEPERASLEFSNPLLDPGSAVGEMTNPPLDKPEGASLEFSNPSLDPGDSGRGMNNPAVQTVSVKREADVSGESTIKGREKTPGGKKKGRSNK